MLKEDLRECLEEFFDDDKKEKVIFIGAGFSKNLGLPTWEEFAYIHLDILKEMGRINFETYELLKKDNFRTIVSMTKDIIFKDDELKERLFKEYIKIFRVDYYKEGINSKNIDYSNLCEENFEEFLSNRDKVKKLERVKDKQGIFSLVYNLNLINVTTNYDDILDILANENNKEFSGEANVSSEEPVKRVYYTENDFEIANNDTSSIKAGNVYHIHGSINDIPNMIVSNEDYIKRYWTGENPFKLFIKRIFADYNVIFLGYSLQELEIINYLFEGEKGTVQKTDSKRILLLDCFDYEKSKLEFLSEYYNNNYSIRLCPYSKSEKGFERLLDIIRKISNIKNEVETKKIGYKRCLELIQQVKLDKEEKLELLEKLKLYKDLQADFFNKINGKYEYFVDISNRNYFNLENVNILALIGYLNSISINIDEVNSEDINNFYNLILKKLDKDIFKYDFIVFIAKYNKKITNFNLDKLLEQINNKEFTFVLICTFLNEFNKEYMFKFFKENDNLIMNLLNKSVFEDNLLSYSILTNNTLINYLLNNENLNFIEHFIKLYEKVYVKDKVENKIFKLRVENNRLIINSKNDTFEEFEVEFNSLKNIYEYISNKGIQDANELKRLIRELINSNSYSSVFDNDYLTEDEKVRFLISISSLEAYKKEVVNRLFESKVYYLKKLALYIIVNNNMIDYLIERINKNDFDLEYMIRNSEFDGEIRECFKLINTYENISSINEKNLLNMIMNGEYYKYDETEEDRIIWLYKRVKELTKFESINKEYEILKDRVKYDYTMIPIIKCKFGSVESIPLIDSQQANKMSISDWLEYINNYKKIEHKEFLKEYDIREDVKIFIECLKRNIDSYMDKLELFSQIENYEWLYYIFTELEGLLKSENNDFQRYYGNILELINVYLGKLENIYEKPKIYSIGKKYLVGKICTILIIILKKIDIERDEFKGKYKSIIVKLEEKISNNDDFNIIFAGKNDAFTSFMNSVHKNLLELEVKFSLKLKDFENEKEYITQLILTRKDKSPKEFYIFLGADMYMFMDIDRCLTESIIKNIESNLEKEMFLSGFAYLRCINEEQYDLLHSIILYLYDNELKDKNVVSNIVQYYVLAFLLEYKNSDLKLIEKKYNLSRECVFKIFKLKESYKKLCLNYNEEDYEDKIIKIWEKILSLKWDINEYHSVEATLEALSNFNSINSEIVENINNVLNYLPGNSGISYKICEYLNRVLLRNNLDYIIEVMKCYKTDLYDRDIIEIIKKVRELSEDKFNEFKEYWLIENRKESPLREYLLK